MREKELLDFASKSLKCPCGLSSHTCCTFYAFWNILCPLHACAFHPLGHVLSSALNSLLHSHPLLLENSHSPFKIIMMMSLLRPSHPPREHQSLLLCGAQSTVFIPHLQDTLPPCLGFLHLWAPGAGDFGEGSTGLSSSESGASSGNSRSSCTT